MRQWYLNSWGYWVLYAKAGQIFLNVTGHMEAQLAAGWRGRGIWRTLHDHGWIWSGELGRISAWEEAQHVKFSEEVAGGSFEQAVGAGGQGRGRWKGVETPRTSRERRGQQG